MASKIPAKSKGEKCKRRVVLTLKEKKDICTCLEKGKSRNVLIQEYNFDLSMIYNIKAQKGQLLKFLLVVSQIKIKFVIPVPVVSSVSINFRKCSDSHHCRDIFTRFCCCYKTHQ
uniref:HTH psq-type domain-containing protein n=1 Tax=Gopherus agassizii TaxID=38772 RepID=A0A452J4G6_9SAUR